MMRKKVFSLFLILLSFSLPLFSRESFIIDSYHVGVVVEDSSLSHFNEYLDLDFTEYSHGIIRDLQYRFDLERFVTIEADITNIRTNTDTVLSYNGDFISLRMGNESSYVYGPVSYQISYDYLLEDDGNRDYDEWYVNLLSPAWDTTVKTFSFSVEFPHPVDKNRLHVTYGSYGSTDELEYVISSDGRTVSGVVHNLRPYSGLTMRAEFDEGYFASKVLKKNYGNLFAIAYLLISLSAIAFIYYSFYKLGRDEEIIAPVKFDPPEGLSSLDVGYIVDNTVTFDKDILSMIFYFADKGYLSIKESGKDEYEFTKLKELDETRPSYERKLFNMIFSKGDTVDTESLALDDFCTKAQTKISSEIERYYENKSPLFEPKSIRRAFLIRAIGIASILLFSIAASINNIGALTLALLVPSLSSFAFLSMIGHRYFANSVIAKKGIKVLQIVVTAFILAILSVITWFDLEYAFSGAIAFLLSLFNTLLVFSSSFFSFAVNKRSDYANKMLSEILGYKEFLETVELERLKVLIEEDPEFYYHNLSYAIALNLEEQYSAKFKTLTYPAPRWYASDYMVDYLIWHNFSTGWRRGYSYQRSQIAPPPSSGGFRGSSGSRFGSSGFSGGGFSGGGGRSW